MSKYKTIFNEMIKENRDLFMHFKIIHDMYVSNPKSHRREFNELGEKVLPIIKDYENRLCGKSENSGYGQFSSNLAEKFWSEVRLNYPKIDFVGIKVS